MALGDRPRGEETTPFTGALGDAHFATPQEVEATGLLGDKGIRLGYYRPPEARGKGWGRVIRYSGDAHLITVAPTGSGKGRDVLVNALLDYEGSCIVIDPKGQLAAITKAQRERMGQKIIVLNPLPKELPMDLGPSARYNPMASLDPESDSFGPDCEAIADSIVMHEEGSNSHFSDSARQLIAGMIMQLATHGSGDEKDLVLVQQLISGPEDVLELFIAKALAADKEGYITGKLARFKSVKGEDRELRSIISTAVTQCGFINNKAIGRSLCGSDFSFRDLKREPTTVYLVLPAKYIEPCGKWFRLVLASAIAALWSDERGKYPVLAILDEFAQLGRLAVIADAMGMARGFGLQLWPILQDLTQLKQHYGDRWETFLGGAAVRQFFAPREHFTAEYVSKLCGMKTVIAQGQSVQHADQFLQPDKTGASWGQHSQPLLQPHNVAGLGPQETLILGPQNTVIDAFRKPYVSTPEFEGLYSTDPYHKTSVPGQNEPTVPENFLAPPANFAERDASVAEATNKKLARKAGTWRAFVGMLRGKMGLATLALLSFVTALAYYVWNNRHNTGPEVLKDAVASQVEISRNITKELEEEARAAELRRQAKADPPATVPSVSPSPASSRPAASRAPETRKIPSDPYAALDAIVDEAHEYNLAHGEVARQRAGPKSDGPDKSINLLPLSSSLGPLMQPIGHVGLVPSIELNDQQSDDARRGAHPLSNLSQTIDLDAGVQAVLLDPTQPEESGSGNYVTGRTKEGEALVEVFTPDNHHTHFISISDYRKCSPVPGYRRIR